MSKLWTIYKSYVHQVGVAIALFLILTTGIIVEVRLILGQEFPAGYDTWIWALVSLVLGVAVGGTAALRATGVPYQQAKAAGKAGSPSINVEGDVRNVTTERQVMPVEQSAGAPDDGAVG